jgi:nicotinic acid mononucleotide adenylyltransferase
VAAERFEMAAAAVGAMPNVGVTQLQSKLGDAGWEADYFEVVRALAAPAASSQVASASRGAASDLDVAGTHGSSGKSSAAGEAAEASHTCGAEVVPMMSHASDAKDAKGGGGPVRVIWVVGSDVAMGMQYWSEKARGLLSACDEVVIVQRGHPLVEIQSVLDGILQPEPTASRVTVTVIPTAELVPGGVSSTTIRHLLVMLLRLIPLPVLRVIACNPSLARFYTALYLDEDVVAAIGALQPILQQLTIRKD